MVSAYKRFKYIYGPVPSWRVGSSLGIDLLSQKEKVCSYDCIYCQLGRTGAFTAARNLYVPENEIIKELKVLPETSIDYITISGRGEPTLASNIGNVIVSIKSLRKEPVAVITNSSLMNRQDVRKELLSADMVIAKFDAGSQEFFNKINQPVSGIFFENILEGIKEFKKQFRGKLALQIMFMQENIEHAGNIAKIAEEINPDEVQINTPLRPCGIEPISRETLSEIKKLFVNNNTVTVYESKKKIVTSISDEDTLKRRGKI